jgi:hypothetical protein
MLKYIFVIIIIYIICQEFDLINHEHDEHNNHDTNINIDIINEVNIPEKRYKGQFYDNKKINNGEVKLDNNMIKPVQQQCNQPQERPQQHQIQKILQQHQMQERPQQHQMQERPQQHQMQERQQHENKQVQRDEPKVWEFDTPNPWSRVVKIEGDEYPYRFFLKIRIPSLNDFQSWKQIVPNIEFDPRGGEIIIPSQDEGSALALANLMVANMGGQLSLQDIIDKKLIQISVSKAQAHEIVRSKLREQIVENLQGKTPQKSVTNYEKDLAQKPNKNEPKSKESMNDTHDIKGYNDIKHKESNEIEAFDGGDYSYI